MQSIQKVNWRTYAQKYDMLLGYNPFYQRVHADVMHQVKKWKIEAGDFIADVGAGTGNYSLALAQYFPQANIIHLDNDEGMNAATREKRKDADIENHQIINKGIQEVNLKPGQLKALVSIHALYTFPEPEKVLKQMHDWLEPGGYAILVNAGRIINVLDWQLAIGWQLVKKYGLTRTWNILKEGKEVGRQNAYIRDMQRRGEFWTHTHEEFCETVQGAGFEVVQSNIAFRGVSDFVVAKKKI